MLYVVRLLIGNRAQGQPLFSLWDHTSPHVCDSAQNAKIQCASVIMQNTSKHHLLHSFTHYTLAHYTLCDAVPMGYDFNNNLPCDATLFKAWMFNLILRSTWKAGEEAGS